MSLHSSNEHVCNICNKVYKSRQSLWNHKHKYHIDVNGYKSTHDCNHDVTPNDNINMCTKCNKIFSCRQHKWRHEKTCNLSIQINKLNKENVEIQELKKENVEIKKENAEIKSMLLELLKKSKVHPKTLEKINKNLIKNINGDLNNVNLGTVNNINIIKFGNENINQILNQKEKLKILEARFLSLEESIKRIHFNDARPEYQNILITNLRDDLAYIFDGNKFVTTKKNTAITELIDNHIDSIEISLDEYKEKLNPRVIQKLEELIDKINDDYTEMVVENNNNKKFQNYKLYKIDQVKNLIYDESKNIKDNKKITQIPTNKLTHEINV
jgi:hypothetical protein